MAENKQTAELTHIKPASETRETEKRDPTMSDGERGLTPNEREAEKKKKTEPQEPPIIQKDVT
jgi:hypothetical protein